METIETNLQAEEAVQKFKQLAGDVSICMFTTIDENLQLTSRPMYTVTIDDQGNAWFFTNEFSEKISEVSKDNVVNLIYAHPGKNIYVTVTGTCSLIIDRKKMEELWTPSLNNWFSEGLSDPKICLVKVTTESASYWNNQTSKMGIFFQMITSLGKGDHYKETEKGVLELTPTQQEK